VNRIVWYLTVLAAGFVCAHSAPAQAILQPPFGLHWGDSPQKLIDWASRHSLDVNLFTPGDQPALRVLKIQPKTGFLPGTQASAVEGRFIGGKMFEITVHYSDPDASADGMEQRFDALRRQITNEQGPLSANQQQRTVVDQFATRTQSFHREPVRGLFILLAFTEVEDLLRKKRESRFSLIYRNDNQKAEAERALAEPAGK
jgi:hypothetical protein